MFCFVFVLVLNAASSRCLELKLKKKKRLHTYFEYAKSNIQVMIAFEYIQIIQVVMMSPFLPLARKESISSYPSCQNKLGIHINEMLLAGRGNLCLPAGQNGPWPDCFIIQFPHLHIFLLQRLWALHNVCKFWVVILAVGEEAKPGWLGRALKWTTAPWFHYWHSTCDWASFWCWVKESFKVILGVDFPFCSGTWHLW